MNRRTIAYQPALDGVRALAVTAVLLFHGGISWMSGGYLGVSVFFTLSGYLITSLLLTEHESTGHVRFGAFYTRRAKRLLPASLLCLVAVSVLAWAGSFDGVSHIRRDVLGGLFQVFNWVQLFGGQSYADLQTATAGLKHPLDHYWSLAIEEQFYWVWPFAFVGLLALARRWRVRPVVVVGGLTAVFAVAAPMIAQWWSADAAYFATPARICEIFAGALAACWLHERRSPEKGIPARWALLAPLALVLLTVGCATFAAASGPAYEGALPLVAVLSASLIIGLQPDGPVRRLLSTRPLVGLGKISYGVYLYHWPVFVLVDRQQWDLSVGAALLVKSAITLAIALASYFLLERPVRTSVWLLPSRTLVAGVGGTLAASLVAAVIIPSVGKYYGADASDQDKVTIDSGPVEPLVPLTTSSVVETTVAATIGADTTLVPTTLLPTTTSTTELPVPPRPVRIVVVGDSTAEATGAGIVSWAAANPQFAQVELVTGAGCGLMMGGYIELDTGLRDVDDECGLYVNEIVPDKIAELRPDLVMVMTTVWDVLDRHLTADGPAVSPTDPGFADAMLASFGEFTDTLLGLGVPRVVWIDEPVPLPSLAGGEDQQGQPARHDAMHAVIAEVARTRPAVRVVDLAGWLAPLALGQDREARIDGVHWAPEASLLIATDFLGPALIQAALS